MDIEKIKQIAEQMPDSPEKQKALQAYSNLKVFQVVASSVEKAELLKVLDMEQHVQERWCAENAPMLIHGDQLESLADLAFRLRDEAVKINQWRYSEIMRDICLKVNTPKADNCSCFDAAMWAEIEGKPIHWIIAALTVMENK